MKYINEYRNKDLVLQLAENIKKISKKQVSFMEVCGGHTMSIQKFGIPSLLPPTIKLLSGPGCPVCVTDKRFIDQSIAYSRLDDVIITTYGVLRNDLELFSDKIFDNARCQNKYSGFNLSYCRRHRTNERTM